MLFEKIQLEDDEKVIMVIRKHWWILVVEMVSIVTLAFIPLVFLFIFSNLENVLSTTLFDSVSSWVSTHTPHLVYMYTAWLLLLWMTLGNFWTDYYLDLWAVTNKRVVLIDQRGFFHRFMSSFRLERLQDMNIETKGVIATLLDYGTIEAQTAGGSNEKFIGYFMPHPRNIKALIVQVADELTTTQSERIATLKENDL